jgi:ABC-type transport system substrate-binding protein
LGLLLSGCTAGGGRGAANSADSTLIAYTGQAGDYQLNFNPFSPSQIAGPGTIYEPLFFLNKAAADSKPEPLLGTEYVWNAAGTELSVTLRDGVKWSDGEAFTAGDVAFTFNLLKEHPALNSLGFKGDVTATDDTHVTFIWDAPAFVSGPDILTQAVIVPEHIWSKIDPETDVVEKPVGTGAYQLGDFKPQAFTLTANRQSRMSATSPCRVTLLVPTPSLREPSTGRPVRFRISKTCPRTSRTTKSRPLPRASRCSLPAQLRPWVARARRLIRPSGRRSITRSTVPS